MPEGKDPDDYIRQNGKESLLNLLKEKDVMYWFPIIEIVLIFTQLNIFVSNIFSKPIHWE